MIFDLSQTDFSKNEKNLSVLGSKEREKFTDGKYFLLKVGTMQTILQEKFCSQTLTLDPLHTFILSKTKECQYFED